MPTTTTTFKEAFAVLHRHSETLRTQQEPDIDNLLAIVTESVDAYKVCKARIDAVEAALKQALSSVDVDKDAAPKAKSANAAPAAEPARGDFDDMADDIPF